ncbi:hypothetical protein LINGRAHAP2_LOCUS15309 [Linum grandiflorum]
MFAIFQEQYARVHEYKMQPIVSDRDNGLYSFIAYKLHKDERLDDRVVTSDVSAGEIRCDCKWWDTMGILCRHSLCTFKLLPGMVSSAHYQTHTYCPGGPEGHVVHMRTYT